MSKPDFNKAVDEWVAERNKHIGEVIIPRVGAYPPQPEVGLFGNVFNEFVNTDLIRHHAEAIGDRNPLWHSNDYARGTIWGGIIAPPTFTESIGCSWAGRKIIKEELEFNLGGEPSGPKRQWFRAIRPGDRMRIIDKDLGVVERKPKQPRPYRLLITNTQRTYINQRDEIMAVVDCRNSALALPLDFESTTGLFAGAGRKRRKLTDEERDAIYRGYDEEKRRGAEPLFWEDVTVGEELKPLVVAPVSIWDTAAFFASIAGECGAFDLHWETIKVNLGLLAYLDAEVNAYRCVGEGHFCDGKGLSVPAAGGHAVAVGAQIDGLICRSICNWMGDYGFLKMLDSQYRNITIQGDALRIKGKVTNKSAEGDEHLVDLDMYCENLDGLLLVPATARVRLPSRT